MVLKGALKGMRVRLKEEKYGDMSLLYRWAPPWERRRLAGSYLRMPMFFRQSGAAPFGSFVFSAAIVKPSRRDAGATRAEPIDTAKRCINLNNFNSATTLLT
jgi:hypothetical protein